MSRASGLFAKRAGSEFENRFRCYVETLVDTSIIRINDGCIRVSAVKLIQTRQPCDWIVLHKSRVIICDTKTSNDKSYSLDEGELAFQLNSLMKVAAHRHTAGYFVEFRGLGEFYWFSIQRIKEILKLRKSLIPKDGLLVGTSMPMKIDFDKIAPT